MSRWASVGLVALAAAGLSVIGLVAVNVLDVGTSERTTSNATTRPLPAVCSVFGPLQEVPGGSAYSLEREVLAGPRGFLDEDGQARTAIAYLALSVGRDAGPGQAVAAYMNAVRGHRADDTIPMPGVTDEIVDSARAVDDALHAGRCKGWQADPP